MSSTPGALLWTPTAAQQQASRLHAYQAWLQRTQGLRCADYTALWQWSVDDVGRFWRSIWDHFEVQADGSPEPALALATMPGARWFPNTRLSYAEHVFRQATSTRPALIVRSEGAAVQQVSWAELQAATGALAAWMRAQGVGPGDRVAAVLPSRTETVVAFLAAASLGAVWSSCSPDMGASVVLDRFRQIEPKLLFTTDSYAYAGRLHDRREVVATLLQGLPSLQAVVHVPGPGWQAGHDATPDWPGARPWRSAVAEAAPLSFTRLPFEHPLWIVYSSGTTGLPKAMVHSHGGIVLTHLKTMALQHDVRPGDRMMFLGSPGWIVWNLLVGGLLVGASIVLFDGHPGFPERDAAWRLADEQGVTLMGCGAAFLTQAMKDGLQPGTHLKFSALRALNATGSPLPVEAYDWVYRAVKDDLWLASISGGTDIASGFVACAPTLPVHAGEIQCPELGVAAAAWNEAGQPVVDEVGELVITQPMPSMPVFFWNDPAGTRYRESYFEHFPPSAERPAVWRHGDWIRFTPQGSAVIYGRSDTTINRHGIRMGTAEIYRVVEDLPELRDSLVVDLEYLGRPSFMPLFVVLQPGAVLDEALKERIRQRIRSQASPRHVPDDIVEVPEVPRTLTGKKMELPVRKLLLGARPDAVASPDAMANPGSFEVFVRYAAGRST
jgi:acetoacetyl-CoA synthetase